MKNKSILIITPGIPPVNIGGEEYYSYYQYKYLQKYNQKVKILTYFSTIPKNANNLLFKIINQIKISKNILSYFILLIYLIINNFSSRFNPDVVHVHDPYSEGLTGVILSKYYKKPLVMTWHGAELVEEKATFTIIGNIIRKFVCNNADIIVVPSDYIKNMVIKYGFSNSNKIKIVTNAVDTNFFKPINKLEAKKIIKKYYKFEVERKIILVVGRLSKIKGIDLLIKSIPYILDDNILLLIVGDGPENKNLKELSKFLKIDKYVHFTGFVDRNFLPLFYNISDVFVLPTLGEGFGLVYLEALSCGIPVITTKYAPEIQELVLKHNIGLSSEVTPEEISKSIMKILNENDKKIIIDPTKLKIIKKIFSWDENISKLLNIYENLT